MKRYSLWLLNNKNVDNMNVSSKFVICLNLVSTSTLLLLLSTRFEWF
ncbi:TPA: stress response membrane protein YncL [Enterobacter hormaechei subsp. steigerwaltii]|nr:stress response membrane protein YncL [Enterobacter hormaechei subsp. steigerwaltii]